MYDLSGAPISSALLWQSALEGTAFGAELELCSSEPITASYLLDTTARIREARLVALENASDAFQTNRQGQGMNPVLKSTPRPTRSSMRLGKTARARRSM